MRTLFIALSLVLATPPVVAAQSSGTLMENHVPHPFNVSDLVMMDRVSEPQRSPDGRYAAFSVRRSTDYAANRGVNTIYAQDLGTSDDQPVKVVAKQESSPRWSADGLSLYYVALAGDVAQLWRLDFHAAKHGLDLGTTTAPVQLSHGLLSI
jgi:dipeptidyl aminopeptidase/acylaminoacyl peptidase